MKFSTENKKKRGSKQPQTMSGTTDHIFSLERLAWQQRRDGLKRERQELGYPISCLLQNFRLKKKMWDTTRLVRMEMEK